MDMELTEPALADGIPVEVDSFCNIASAVDESARREPFKPAIFYPEGRNASGRVRYSHYTFRQLINASDAIAHGLGDVGITRGMRTVLMVRPSLEFFALTFALFRAGVVPVFVDPGMGWRNLGTCLDEAEPEAFIGVTEAHLARLALGWGREAVRITVNVGPKGPWAAHTLEDLKRVGAGGEPFEIVRTNASDLAAIIFTSGSTGVPKGVVYNHGNFTAQVELLRGSFTIEPGEIDLPTFPLFSLFDFALGMTTIVPDMNAAHPAKADPAKIVEAIEDFGVTNMFGSPALLNNLGRYCERHSITLPTVRRVISAGAPVSADIVERVMKALPHPEAEVFTPYGATECLPVSLIGSREILGVTRQRTGEGAGVCVGRPVRGIEAKIIPISDEPVPVWDDSLALPPGQVGEIVVKGGPVTLRYYNRDRATALAKIEDADGSTRHRMGDLGYFDYDGRLWFCGRKSQRVVTPQGVLFTDPVEGVFNAHPLVYRTALVGVGADGQMRPVLCVELEQEAYRADRARITAELQALGAQHAHTRNVTTILFHPAFPVDIRHNSKIFREKLALWAAGELRAEGRLK